MKQRLRPSMRKGFSVALLLAIVAMPIAFGGAGFCRSMPCCTPHPAAHLASIHQPDCCDATNCEQAPAAVGEYTTAKQVHRQTLIRAHTAVAIVPAPFTISQPRSAWMDSPPLPPPALQRRIAILSTLLI